MMNALKSWAFWILVVVGLMIPIISGFYKYFLTKNYDFLVEAKCDPSIEVCFQRDCTIVDECPPNNLDYYKLFYIKAFDFEKCSDNSCAAECESGLIECAAIQCGESEDDFCTTDAT